MAVKVPNSSPFPSLPSSQGSSLLTNLAYSEFVNIILEQCGQNPDTLFEIWSNEWLVKWSIQFWSPGYASPNTA